MQLAAPVFAAAAEEIDQALSRLGVDVTGNGSNGVTARVGVRERERENTESPSERSFLKLVRWKREDKPATNGTSKAPIAPARSRCPGSRSSIFAGMVRGRRVTSGSASRCTARSRRTWSAPGPVPPTGLALLRMAGLLARGSLRLAAFPGRGPVAR